MGGFAGGDESGYWDVDDLISLDDDTSNTTSSAFKPNIEINTNQYSIKVYSKTGDFYNAISFVPCQCEVLTIEDFKDTSLAQKSISQAYKALSSLSEGLDILDFFYEYKVTISKDIPSKTNLEEVSSYTMAFMYLAKEVYNLVLSSEELIKISNTIDAQILEDTE
ncbi:MAG: hypothetical protein Q9M40_01140 [Sulfurimonas sp.]|nr:hypothetical protein [Sulfurimonas sp.]MDQ7066701.1 hypothetical protein [Sulfurimonas sp.]